VTEWERYGTESGNPKCRNCMVHSGYEASAVNDTFTTLRGLWGAARATLFGPTYGDAEALKALENSSSAAPGGLVPLTVGASRNDERSLEHSHN